MKRPLALTIVGVVWFLFGLAGMAANTMKQGLAIPDTNFFYLVVGAGLLKGWRWCRWYALFAAGAAFIIGLFGAPWVLMNVERIVIRFPAILFDDRPHQLVSWPVVFFAVLSYVALSGWIFSVLMRRDVKQFFVPLAPVVIR